MKVPEIRILSRKELSQLVAVSPETVIISITDKNSSFVKLNDTVSEIALAKLFIRFNDVENTKEYGCITFNQANLINQFIESNKDEISTIIVSCDGGQGRSPAIAASLILKFKGDAIKIWESGKYCPNILVFKTMLDVLYINEEIDDEMRYQLNINRWVEVHKDEL